MPITISIPKRFRQINLGISSHDGKSNRSIRSDSYSMKGRHLAGDQPKCHHFRGDHRIDLRWFGIGGIAINQFTRANGGSVVIREESIR